MVDETVVVPVKSRSTWRSPRRAIPALGLGLIAVIAPAIVLAATFNDVPPSNSFYVPIEKVNAARITTGCGGNNYCPKATVTREQMAAFLSRTGGVGEQATGGTSLSLAEARVLASVTIKPGDLPGGAAFIQLIGTFGMYTEDTAPANYPYKSVFVLAQNGLIVGFEHYIQMTALASDGFADASGAVQVLVQAPTGVSGTFDLVGLQLTGAEGQVFAYGTIDAIYAPFSAGGGWVDPEPGLLDLDNASKMKEQLDRGSAK